MIENSRNAEAKQGSNFKVTFVAAVTNYCPTSLRHWLALWRRCLAKVGIDKGRLTLSRRRHMVRARWYTRRRASRPNKVSHNLSSASHRMYGILHSYHYDSISYRRLRVSRSNYRA
jgi:hypothetical protein